MAAVSGPQSQPKGWPRGCRRGVLRSRPGLPQALSPDSSRPSREALPGRNEAGSVLWQGCRSKAENSSAATARVARAHDGVGAELRAMGQHLEAFSAGHRGPFERVGRHPCTDPRRGSTADAGAQRRRRRRETARRMARSRAGTRKKGLGGASFAASEGCWRRFPRCRTGPVARRSSRSRDAAAAWLGSSGLVGRPGVEGSRRGSHIGARWARRGAGVPNQPAENGGGSPCTRGQG